MAAGRPIKIAPAHAKIDSLILPPPGRYGGRKGVRASILTAAIAQFEPDLVFVDDEPSGHEGEFISSLEHIAALRNPPKLVAGFRDILSSPESIKSYWAAHSHADSLDRYYDRALVFGDRTMFDPVSEYDWSESIANKTEYCGYMRPPVTEQSSSSLRATLTTGDQPLLVATAGAGGDGAVLLEATAKALIQPALSHIAAMIVTGPRARPDLYQNLVNATAGRPNISIETFRDDLPACIAAADIVISMAGANTVSEILAHQQRAILVPRNHSEQLLRAQLLSERGLVEAITRDDLTPELLANTILQQLAKPPPTHDLDFNGLARAGDILEDLLSPQITPFAG